MKNKYSKEKYEIYMFTFSIGIASFICGFITGCFLFLPSPFNYIAIPIAIVSFILVLSLFTERLK